MKSKDLVYLCKCCGETNPLQFYGPNARSACKVCTRKKRLEHYHNLPIEQKAARLPKNQVKHAEQMSRWQRSNLLRYRYLSARYRAKKKKLEFSITEEDLKDIMVKQRGKCFYSGLPIDKNLSVDRKNSKIGYTLNNTVLTRCDINYMKHDADIGHFLFLVNTIYNYQQSNPLSSFI